MEDTLFSHQLGVSILLVHSLQFVKKSAWFPWINEHSDKINRVVAILAALASSAGFQFAMNGSWLNGGVLAITIPAFGALVLAFSHVLLHTIAQAGIQQVYYQNIVKSDKSDKSDESLRE
jgi:hypothetical protein